MSSSSSSRRQSIRFCLNNSTQPLDIDEEMLNKLEKIQKLNWWKEIGLGNELFPLATPIDGNCLMHSASLAVYGYCDHNLDLRRKVHKMLSEGAFKDSLYRRWRFQQSKIYSQCKLVLDDSEWESEWNQIIDAASVKENNDPLEEIHILALSYVLKRPIIVLCDDFLRNANEEKLSPISIGGIFVPFGVTEKKKIPLVLSYNNSHFTPLVSMSANENISSIIPFVDSHNDLMPIHFHFDPPSDFDWSENTESEYHVLKPGHKFLLFTEFFYCEYCWPEITPDDHLDTMTEENLANNDEVVEVLDSEDECDNHAKRVEKIYRRLGYKRRAGSHDRFKFFCAHLKVPDGIPDHDDIVTFELTDGDRQE